MDSSNNFQHTVKFKVLTDFFFIILIQVELYSHSMQNIARLPNGKFFTNPEDIN